jgi:pimeloyl-ACP methyl ester carboxylesterase
MTRLALAILSITLFACGQTAPSETDRVAVTSDKTPSVTKIVLDEHDSINSYYLAIEPESDTIEGVLVLLSGFGQEAGSVFPETKLDSVAFANNILTIAVAGGNKLYADSAVRSKLTSVLEDILNRYKADPEKFVLGGYSAGGMIALRYVELCNEFPDNYPIHPKGVFMVDSPIDIFTVWNNLAESAENGYSDVAVEEAERAMKIIEDDYGLPLKNISIYSELTAFSMDKKYGEHEVFLKNIAVRAYHDVDIEWRLINRNQTVKESNFYVTSELINRLLLMGNERAEFMQSYQTGYRSDGQRHPHSWSIVDAAECVAWARGLWK